MSSSVREPASLRSLGLSVYLPTLLFAVGQGAVIPIVPLAARQLGASVAFASFVVALRGFGVLAFDVPAGWLVARFGEGRAMAVGTALVLVALVGAVCSTSPVAFAAFTLLMGCGWSVWLLARLSYVTEVMSVEQRGRALSTLGGVNRVGNFIGPFLGALVSYYVGTAGAYYIHIATALGACVLILLLVQDSGEEPHAAAGHAPVHFMQIAREHAGVFLTAGVGALAIGALRASRQGVLPLWAESIGLDADAVSLIFGISMAMEVSLFYPAGSAMDRFGRKWVAVPCLAIMSLGMLLLPLATGFWSLVAVGLLIGFGNGLGAGIIMTLGADFSPAVGRAQFLGAWRVCGDLGVAGGPGLVSTITALISLGAGCVSMAILGAVGALMILLRMPETLQRTPAAETAARFPDASKLEGSAPRKRSAQRAKRA